MHPPISVKSRLHGNGKPPLSLLIILLVFTSILSLGLSISAYDVGGACTFDDDTDDTWFNAVRRFVEIIDSYPNWSQHFLNDYPDVGPYMWTEQAYGGSDDAYADWTEASLILGHSRLLYRDSRYVMSLGFGANNGCASPYEIRLGYQSPDGLGWSKWTFILQCSVLRDDEGNIEGVSAWLQTLTGIHMVLGFANDFVLTNNDPAELAYRLTGTGGYPKESVQDAFFHTFVKYDDVHRNNVARIIAENAYVADNDYIDSFEHNIEVDEVKLIITCYFP